MVSRFLDVMEVVLCCGGFMQLWSFCAVVEVLEVVGRFRGFVS